MEWTGDGYGAMRQAEACLNSISDQLQPSERFDFLAELAVGVQELVECVTWGWDSPDSHVYIGNALMHGGVHMIMRSETIRVDFYYIGKTIEIWFEGTLAGLDWSQIERAVAAAPMDETVFEELLGGECGWVSRQGASGQP